MRKSALTLALCAPFFAFSTAKAAHELDNRDVTAGQGIYAENCASCHGAKLEGQPDWQSPDENGVLPAPPHDQTGHTWHHDNATLFDYTKLGGAGALAQRGITGFASGMPGFAANLSDEEIWTVLAYIHSTWPARIQQNHAMRNPPHK